MKIVLPRILALSLLVTGACASTPRPPQAPAPAAREGLQIRHTSVYVDDQDKALRFYTEVLGLAKKDDFSNSGYRWLTVMAPGDRDGSELQLALADNPAAKTYQEALLQANQPSLMLYTSDVKRDYERIKARGAELTMPPTEVMAGSVIAQLKDGCGNLIQLTQLAK